MAKKIQPAETTLYFADSVTNLDGKYIDIAQCLSNINRRTYEQGKVYFLESVKTIMSVPAGYDSSSGSQVAVSLATIADNWVSRNAWVKAKAAWRTMQDKVLDDNPSVEGKWNQFLVFMDAPHYAGGSSNLGPNLNLLPAVANSASNILKRGEWDTSTFVRPQHEVDPATGEPLAADEFFGHMIGANSGSLAPGSTLLTAGIIEGYQDTRARVVESPTVPAAMSDSWLTLLTDTGSQEPELAEIIESEGDNPPYDIDEFVGASGNADGTWIQAISLTSLFSPDDLCAGFAVPLGLLKLDTSEVVASEKTPQNPTMLIEIKLAKGHYKGVACMEMRQ